MLVLGDDSVQSTQSKNQMLSPLISWVPKEARGCASSWEKEGEDSALGRVRCFGVSHCDLVEDSAERAGGTAPCQERHVLTAGGSLVRRCEWLWPLTRNQPFPGRAATAQGGLYR